VILQKRKKVKNMSSPRRERPSGARRGKEFFAREDAGYQQKHRMKTQ
jgi:hypothetical protein